MRQEVNGSNIALLFGGQGAQKQGMFKELVHSQNPHLRNASEEILEKLKGLGSEGSDIVDIYYSSDANPLKINSTRNVQPGLAAYYMILYRGLENQLGCRVPIDAASGYSFGVIPSLRALGVISTDEDELNIAMMRGESMSLIKPHQFYVITIKTKEPAHVKLINNWALRRTGYRVCIRLAPDTISLSGDLRTKDKMERRLGRSGIVRAKIPLDEEIYYAPFHNCWEMRPFAKLFEHTLKQYCERRTEETGEPLFKDLTGKLFVTNGGKVLKNGQDIMNYIAYPHIVQICDFNETIRRVGKSATNCIGIGPVNLKRYSEMGYIRDFHILSDASRLEEAARWYDTIMERRARDLLHEQIPQKKLVPSYR